MREKGVIIDLNRGIISIGKELDNSYYQPWGDISIKATRDEIIEPHTMRPIQILATLADERPVAGNMYAWPVF